jgi:hypothetical protein
MRIAHGEIIRMRVLFTSGFLLAKHRQVAYASREALDLHRMFKSTAPKKLGENERPMLFWVTR